MNYPENISGHITFQEATFDQTASRKGMINLPDEEQLAAMKLIAEKIFEPCRIKADIPLWCTSFFRTIALNAITPGSSSTSQHCKGEAIDIISSNKSIFTNAMLFFYIKESFEFDQLIWEYGNDNEPDWVHVSYSKNKCRNMMLRSYRINGRVQYLGI